MERERLEPDEGASQISKLRISLKIRTPDFPSNTRIWHSIWHWINSVPCKLLVPCHIASHCYFYRDNSVDGELQEAQPHRRIQRLALLYTSLQRPTLYAHDTVDDERKCEFKSTPATI